MTTLRSTAGRLGSSSKWLCEPSSLAHPKDVLPEGVPAWSEGCRVGVECPRPSPPTWGPEGAAPDNAFRDQRDPAGLTVFGDPVAGAGYAALPTSTAILE
jgi:hypothetical protein